MSRIVTLFTGQWADMPLSELAPLAKKMGYDGLELACWGDHLDVFRASEDPSYVEEKKAFLEDHGLELQAISNHLAGQLVADPNNDSRSDGFAPADCAGNSEKKRAWAIEAMKRTAIAAKNFGVPVVNGFVGSPIWHLLYSFPPVPDSMLDEGFSRFADLWNPILDVFDAQGIRFALEVHPTEIAFDIPTSARTLEALGNRKTFGFNFDPSHLIWQGIDPAAFIRAFPDRIYHVHMKDAWVSEDPQAGILGSHLNFGHPARGWDFRSVGRGDVDFEAIIRELNRIQYQGPLSVEWEDPGMDRIHGAAESCAYVKNLDFPESRIAFDAAFDKNNQ